jgi:high-affinity Fe2+/Pb2+ permease
MMDSEKIMSYLKDYRISIPVGVILGLILGLVIGWGI